MLALQFGPFGRFDMSFGCVSVEFHFDELDGLWGNNACCELLGWVSFRSETPAV